MSLDQIKPATNDASYSPDIARRYQELREAAIVRGEMKRKSAYAKHEMLRKADLAVREAGAEQLEKSLRGGSEAVFARVELADAIARRSEILRDLGYDTHFDEPDYSCHICSDTGVAEGERCVCFKTVAYPMLYTESNLQAVAKQTFENFDLTLFSEQPEVEQFGNQKRTLPSSRDLHSRLLDASKQYCESFKREEADSFIYYGRTGTGKTYLAACIGHELLRQGNRVFFVSFTEMMQRLAQYRILLNSFNPDPLNLDRATTFYRLIHDADMLIIDDLGSGSGDSGTHSSEMIQLLDDRFAKKRPVIITSNLDLEKIQRRYDERLLSRILGSMKPIRLYGQDVRVQKERR